MQIKLFLRKVLKEHKIKLISVDCSVSSALNFENVHVRHVQNSSCDLSLKSRKLLTSSIKCYQYTII